MCSYEMLMKKMVKQQDELVSLRMQLRDAQQVVIDISQLLDGDPTDLPTSIRSVIRQRDLSIKKI